MTTLVLVLALCLTVIVAGPADIAPAAGFGVATTFLYAIATDTVTMPILTLTLIGVTLFGFRAILRLLTGHGALIRLQPQNQPHTQTRRRDPDRDRRPAAPPQDPLNQFDND